MWSRSMTQDICIPWFPSVVSFFSLRDLFIYLFVFTGFMCRICLLNIKKKTCTMWSRILETTIYCMYAMYSTKPLKTTNKNWINHEYCLPEFSVLKLWGFQTRQVWKSSHTAHNDRLTLLISAGWVTLLFPSTTRSALLPGLLRVAWTDTCCICVSVCGGVEQSREDTSSLWLCMQMGW